MKHLIPTIIGCLALAGLGLCAFLTLAHFNLITMNSAGSNEACNFTTGSCDSVITSDKYDIAGIPNAILGAAYFALILAAVYTRLIIGHWPSPLALLAVIIAGIAFSAYMTHMLVFDIRIPCPYCLTAHAINGALALLYLVSLRIWG